MGDVADSQETESHKGTKGDGWGSRRSLSVSCSVSVLISKGKMAGHGSGLEAACAKVQSCVILNIAW